MFWPFYGDRFTSLRTILFALKTEWQQEPREFLEKFPLTIAEARDFYHLKTISDFGSCYQIFLK